VRRQPPQKFTTAVRIVDVQEEVRAEVRLGAMAENCRLNVVEVDGGAVAEICAEAIFSGHGGLPRQPILSRNSSVALPMRSSRLVSTTVRFGLATYQKSAVI